MLIALFAVAALSLGQAPPADFREAISLAVSGEYEPALRLFRNELAKDPDDPLANYYVGMTEYKLDRFAACTAFLEKAVEKRAPFPQAYFWLAKAYLEIAKEPQAIAILKRGLSRFPANKDLMALGDELGVEGQ